jgi:hypothetical protein
VQKTKSKSPQQLFNLNMDAIEQFVRYFRFELWLRRFGQMKGFSGVSGYCPTCRPRGKSSGSHIPISIFKISPTLINRFGQSRRYSSSSLVLYLFWPRDTDGQFALMECRGQQGNEPRPRRHEFEDELPNTKRSAQMSLGLMGLKN